MDEKERAELYELLHRVFQTLANWFDKKHKELKSKL